MNERGTFIATLLDSSRRAYAAGSVLRLQEAGPAQAQLVESFGFQALVEDTEVRVQHLAESLACGRPEVFLLDARWLSATYGARQLPPELLSSSLSALMDELSESLPPDAAALAGEYVRAALDGIEEPVKPAPSLLEAEEKLVQEAREFLVAVLEGNRAKAERVLFDALEGGASISDLHHGVIAKVQGEVGRMWQAGEVHVGEEHFGSQVVTDVLAQLRARAPKPDGAGRSVLVASVAGNLHDIGARIVADHFELSGWRPIFLGANTPAMDLTEAVRDFEPDLVALSVGLVLHLRAAAATIAELAAAFPNKPVLVGGRPFALVDDLWKDVGAHGCALDGASAVSAAESLLA